MPARTDVVVVGGGPSGALTAAAAAEHADTVLIERAPNRPVRCAGLIGPQGRKALELPQSHVLAEIRRVRVLGPDEAWLELVSSVPKGFVVDRARLDQLLLERAREAGADVRLGVAATGWEPGKLLTTRGEVEAPVVVGADGPCSGVARWAGLPRAPHTLVGLQAIVDAAGPEDCVELILGGELPAGCFGWTVPAGPGRVRVGVATLSGREGAEILGRLLCSRFPGARTVERTAGLIPVGAPEVTTGRGVLLVGDAAGQVKPLSGGGLYYGALCARLAGECAARGPEYLQEYERRWREELEEEIAFGLAARRLVEELSEEEVVRVVQALRGTRIAAFLAEEGDIDRPASLLREMLRRPSLWAEGFPLLGALGGWKRLQGLVSGLRSPPGRV